MLMETTELGSRQLLDNSLQSAAISVANKCMHTLLFTCMFLHNLTIYTAIQKVTLCSSAKMVLIVLTIIFYRAMSPVHKKLFANYLQTLI